MENNHIIRYLEYYFNDVYVCLLTKNTKTVYKSTFIQFINLPPTLGEMLYSAILSFKGKFSKKYFTDTMINLYIPDNEYLNLLCFKILSDNNVIKINYFKNILNYLSFYDKSLNDIRQQYIVKNLFDNKEELTISMFDYNKCYLYQFFKKFIPNISHILSYYKNISLDFRNGDLLIKSRNDYASSFIDLEDESIDCFDCEENISANFARTSKLNRNNLKIKGLKNENNTDNNYEFYTKLIFEYESYVYKLSNNNNFLKKVKLRIKNKDLFFFSTETSREELIISRNLSGSFIEIGENKIFNNNIYFSFIIHFIPKTKVYYCKSEIILYSWINIFQKNLRIRNIIREYRFLDIIGKGGFGEVLSAQNLNTGEKVAIKVIKKRNDYFSFLNEIEILKFCNNNNLLKYIDHYEDLDKIYIVTNYIEGVDLKTYIRGKFLSEKKVTKILIEIIEAMSYLQEKKIIHRDIKPSNIIINEFEDKVTLIDFGLAKFIFKEYLNGFVGTINYTAPEVLNNNNYSFKADIWSLGVTVYNILIKEIPFDIKKNNFFEYEFDNSKWSYVSYQLRYIIKNCLNINDRERFDVNTLKSCLNYLLEY